MKKIIGITGGVGSGKSTVLSILDKEYKARIIEADKIGHEAFIKNSDTYNMIIDHFGKQILSTEGEIDHKKLAKIIFNDEKEKEYLNGIIHPFVLDRIRSEISLWKNSNSDDQISNTASTNTKNHNGSVSVDLMIIETALMFETGCDKLCDEVWVVITDKYTRINRLIKDRGYTKEKAEAIIASQLSDNKMINKCNKIINNNSDIAELKKQIDVCL